MKNDYKVSLADLGLTHALEKDSIFCKYNLVSPSDTDRVLQLANDWWQKFINQAKRDDPLLINYLREVFCGNTQEVKSALDDLKNERKTQTSLFPVYNKVLDIYPLGRTEMTEAMLNGEKPNWFVLRLYHLMNVWYRFKFYLKSKNLL
jgi:hypothetical protein